MFLDDLVKELNDLPYEELQLFLKMNELTLRTYKSNVSVSGRKSALEMLKGVLVDMQNSIEDKQSGKSK
ncbi:MAG: hypothetical protein ACI31V_02505 [Bacilli bacterium]